MKHSLGEGDADETKLCMKRNSLKSSIHRLKRSTHSQREPWKARIYTDNGAQLEARLNPFLERSAGRSLRGSDKNYSRPSHDLDYCPSKNSAAFSFSRCLSAFRAENAVPMLAFSVCEEISWGVFREMGVIIEGIRFGMKKMVRHIGRRPE